MQKKLIILLWTQSLLGTIPINNNDQQQHIAALTQTMRDFASAIQPLIHDAIEQSAPYCDQVQNADVEKIIETVFKNVSGGFENINEENIEKFAAAFGKGLGKELGKNLGEELSTAFNNGFEDFLDHFAEHFKPGGLGHQAITNLMTTFPQALDIALHELNPLLEAGGSAHIVIQNFGNNGVNLVNQLGNEVNAQADSLVTTFNRNADSLLITLNTRLSSLATGLGIRFIAGTFGTVMAWYGTKIGLRMLNKYLHKPRLLLYVSKPLKNAQTIRIDMVFAPSLEAQLNNIVNVTNRVHTLIKHGKTNIQYRNLLLYGPPGTGKTMFAKKLAQKSGMAFAFMTGASLFQLDTASAIKELDSLFQWAHKQNGLLLFIDEIEILLAKRESLKPDSAEYKILNHFLSLTGERSNKFMIVGATNRLNILDDAFERRFDDMIEIPLPTQSERARVLDLYCNQILYSTENDAQFVQAARNCLTPEVIEQIALKTEGLSNGDLSGIINTLQTDAISSQAGIITPELITIVVDRALEKHHNFLRVHTLIPQAA